jgi:hypothetical protein
MVTVTLLRRLLSANCQPGCPPPIHLSSLPWLVVVLPLGALHPPPPVVFTTCRLLLSSSCHATFTSHHLEMPPAFKTPSTFDRWCLQLVVTTPLVALLPLLLLSTIRCLLSVNASPPVGLLFSNWLSRHPCCCTAAASCPLNMPPPPRNKLPPPRDVLPPLVCWHLSSCLPLFFRLVVTSHLVAPLPQVFILNPHLHLHRLVVASHLVALLPPPVLLSTPPPFDALATHLPFAS